MSEQPTALPAPPTRDNRPIEVYAADVVRYVIRTGCTATLTTEDLEWADHAIGYAVARQPRDGEDLEPYFTALHAARRLVLAALARRRTPEPPPAPVVAPLKSENEGPMAPLLPTPLRRPPVGNAIRF